MKTYLYKFDPLKPHFYVVKLGFIGVYMYIIMPRHPKSGGVLCYTLWNLECPSVSAPTIRPQLLLQF